MRSSWLRQTSLAKSEVMLLRREQHFKEFHITIAKVSILQSLRQTSAFMSTAHSPRFLNSRLAMIKGKKKNLYYSLLLEINITDMLHMRMTRALYLQLSTYKVGSYCPLSK